MTLWNMNKFVNYIPINISSVYYGVEMDFISCSIAERFIYRHRNIFVITDSQMVSLFLYKEDKSKFLEFLNDTFILNLNNQKRLWEWIIVKSIMEVECDDNHKIEQLSIQWARFDYPELWTPFFFCYPLNSDSFGIKQVQHFMDREKAYLETIFHFE